MDDDLDSLDPSELLPTHISSSAASSSADACGAPALPPLFTHVKLVSKEGQDFLVEKEIALVSGTIRTMLTGAGRIAITYFVLCKMSYAYSSVLECVVVMRTECALYLLL